MHCSVCQSEFKPEATTAMPFCSARCRTIDLGRWLEEGYSLPEVPNIEADETPEDDWAQERSEPPNP
ncbi:MAG: DNA gyrase inhibitor YacG [Planctomycetes bacterium]|nr:DNA gyrase inhibitor YacG [Planctomycetota bacterium]